MKIILEEIKSVISLINELHTMPEEYSRHRNRLVASCGVIFDSSIAVAAIARESEGGHRFRGISITGDQDSLTQEQVRTLLGGDSGVIAHLRNQKSPVAAVTQGQLLDAKWTPSSMYRELLDAGSIGDGMWCVYAPQESWDECFVIAVFRTAAHSFPFANRDRQILEILIEGLRWTLDASLHPHQSQAAINLGPGLAPRLQRLLDCLIVGKSEKQAARELGITKHTVHTYVKELYRVLGVASRGELFARATMRANSIPQPVDSDPSPHTNDLADVNEQDDDSAAAG